MVGDETAPPAPVADAEGDVTMGEAAATASEPTPAPTSSAPSAEAGPSSQAATAANPTGSDAEVNGATEEDDSPEAKPLRGKAIATLGIALIAMGEEVGAEMAVRQFQHLVSLCKPRPAGCRRRASWTHFELRGAHLLPLPAHPGPALALPPHHGLQVQAATMVCGGHREDHDVGHACAVAPLEREGRGPAYEGLQRMQAAPCHAT